MASERVIKTFIARFKIDNTSLIKGFSRLGETAGKAIDKIKDRLSIKGILGSLKNSIKGFQDNVLDFSLFSERTGLDIKKASQLGSALEMMGGSAEEAKSIMGGLQQAITDASFGGGPLIDAAKKYGLALLDENGQLLKTEQLMDNIAERMKTMSKSEQVDFANMLGLGDAGTMLFSKGKDFLNKQMQGSLFSLNKDDANLSIKLHKNLTQIKHAGKMIGLEFQKNIVPIIAKFTKILAEKLPDIIKGTKQFIKFLGEIPKKFKQILMNSKWGRAYLDYTKTVINAIKDLFNNFSFDNFLKGFSAIKDKLGNFATAIAKGFKPALDKVGGFVADISKKIWGKLTDGSIDYGAILNTIKNAVGNIGSMIGTLIGKTFRGAFKLGQWIADSLKGDGLSKVGESIINFFKGVIDVVKSLFTNMFASIWAEISDTGLGKMMTSAGETIGNIKDKTVGFFGNVADFFTGKNKKDNKNLINNINTNELNKNISNVNNANYATTNNITNNNNRINNNTNNNARSNKNINITNKIVVNGNNKNNSGLAAEIAKQQRLQLNNAVQYGGNSGGF